LGVKAAQKDFTRQTVEQNRHLISEVRLWDWHALDAVYKQFQAIRLYYEFVDVDVDRYRIDDRALIITPPPFQPTTTSYA
jgi:uncharacterized membrane protein (UPF0182 family)